MVPFVPAPCNRRLTRTLSSVLNKARFWERFAQQSLNERQVEALNKLLDDFEGKLTTRPCYEELIAGSRTRARLQFSFTLI